MEANEALCVVKESEAEEGVFLSLSIFLGGLIAVLALRAGVYL